MRFSGDANPDEICVQVHKYSTPPERSTMSSPDVKTRLLKKRPYMPYKTVAPAINSVSSAASVSTEASPETVISANGSNMRNVDGSRWGSASAKQTRRGKRRSTFTHEERAQRKLESNRRSANRKREEYEHTMTKLRIDFGHMQASNKKLKYENQELAAMTKALRETIAHQEETRLEGARRQMQTKRKSTGLAPFLNPNTVTSHSSTAIAGALEVRQRQSLSLNLLQTHAWTSLPPPSSYHASMAQPTSQHVLLGLLSKVLASQMRYQSSYK